LVSNLATTELAAASTSSEKRVIRRRKSWATGDSKPSLKVNTKHSALFES
jgi:hypothetical protein